MNIEGATLTLAYIPSRFLDGFFFLAASSSDLSGNKRRTLLPSVALFCGRSVAARFSRDTCRLALAIGTWHSITDATELRPDGIELILVKLELLRWVEFLGVGGSGELAWRFSGLGEPRFPTELVQLDDEAIIKLILKFTPWSDVRANSIYLVLNEPFVDYQQRPAQVYHLLVR